MGRDVLRHIVPPECIADAFSDFEIARVPADEAVMGGRHDLLSHGCGAIDAKGRLTVQKCVAQRNPESEIVIGYLHSLWLTKVQGG